MNAPRDIDRTLEGWFAEGPPMAADRVVAGALARLSTMPQQRARRGPAGWSARLRVLAVGLGAALVVAAVLYLLTPRKEVGPQPTPTPTPTLTPTVLAYDTHVFDVPISFVVPRGWSVHAEDARFVDFGSSAIMSIADTNVIDDQGLPQRWPADLQAWLATEPAFGPAEVVSRSVGLRPALVLTVSVDYTPPAPGDRKPKIGFGPNDWRLVDSPERWRFVQVLTGADQGFIILLISSPEAFGDDAARLDGLLASLQFR